MTTLKQILIMLGARLSQCHLLQIQAAVNYLRLGHWMRSHHFSIPKRVQSRERVWDAVLDQVADRKVLYLEFGVAYGDSIQYWSRGLRHAGSILHGFDSFEGLPEEAGPWRKGQFDAKGECPHTSDPRVRFIKGWFEDVLPDYRVPEHELMIVNMDADIYSSTIYVLRRLKSFVKPGTFVYFDEMNHVDHEPRALAEFMDETGLKFELISADKTLAVCCFKCVG